MIEQVSGQNGEETVVFPMPHLRDLSNFFMASFIIQTAVSLQLAWPEIAATSLDQPGLQHFSTQWCCVQLRELFMHVGTGSKEKL